ncbi:hypothetical protein [Streptomyces sp. NPDC094049]|uniref:hypothetical protein n=1 Tax=Streptomyces sp. NPDC094049 TaxID=3154987 RepID=UPI0033262FE1
MRSDLSATPRADAVVGTSMVIFAEADARSWEAWRAYGTTGQERTVAAARAWVDYGRTP